MLSITVIRVFRDECGLVLENIVTTCIATMCCGTCVCKDVLWEMWVGNMWLCMSLCVCVCVCVCVCCLSDSYGPCDFACPGISRVSVEPMCCQLVAFCACCLSHCSWLLL